MSTLPNPWLPSSAEVVMPSVDTAAASPVIAPGPVDAAANHFDGADVPMAELVNRGFDPEHFVADIEPPLAAY